MIYDDGQRAAYTAAEIKGLLMDQWQAVTRIAKHIERYGRLTPHLLHGGIARELCLLHRDTLVLSSILHAYAEDGVVNMAALREACAAERLPLNALTPRRPPPYAVRGVAQASHSVTLEERRQKFSEALHSAAGNKRVVSRRTFAKAINAVEAFGVSDREVADLCTVLDPKRAGTVDIDDFCDRFALQFLKPKSMRPQLGKSGADGRSNPFEWPTVDAAPRPPRTARAAARSAAAHGGPRPPSFEVRSTRAANLRRTMTEEFRRSETRSSSPNELPSLPQSATRWPHHHNKHRINLHVVGNPKQLGNVVSDAPVTSSD